MHLRKVTENDNYLLREWRNANVAFFPPRDGEITEAEQRLWYHQRYAMNPCDHMYMVCAPFKLGTVAIDLATATIHRVMRGRPGGEPGAMTKGLRELMRIYPFQAYELQVLECNEHAIRFYEQAGFTRIGHEEHASGALMVRMLCVLEDRL